MSGNEAAGEAAFNAGCLFYAGYPITPQNQLTEYMSRRMAGAGRVFIQAESEIAAVNMVFGAASAGARAMTSSSSPGISLKQEGISYLAACRLPSVIINMNRAGPGLGDVTPSQADYFQSTRGGGHGDYRTITFGPESVQEIYDLTYEAFGLAEKYRNPVLILGDAILAQLMEPVRTRRGRARPPARPGWSLGHAEGRGPRTVLSLFLQPGVTEAHNRTLQANYRRAEKGAVRWQAENTAGAEVILVAFGSSARICREAMVAERDAGIPTGLFRPVSLWPFPAAALGATVAPGVKFLVVEMNQGQMIEDVRLAVNGRAPVFFYGRTGGGVPGAEEVRRALRRLRDGKNPL